MLFHTWTFVLFFLVFYPVYLGLKGTRFKVPWLLAASYSFYACWEPFYLLLILYLTVVDYVAVARIASGRGRRAWLSISIVNSVALLGFFKYGAFVTNNLNGLFAWLSVPYQIAVPGTYLAEALNSLLVRCRLNELLAPLGVSYQIPDLGAVLPVGISFYVFRSMSYTIDCYRGKIERETSFIRYAAFVSLFPQLLMGPIDRAGSLLPQLRNTPRITRQDVADGLSLFVVGLFKKVALADYLAVYVNQVYDSPGDYQAPALILATFAFAWQICFDFSGYTDMARGIARLMGIRLMLNFNNPYLATGLGDFWRRWHISLSTWFRDYVYIPLGGNRKGTFNTYRNMCLAMLISGLWHGAAWTFVIWGALHAVGYSLTRYLEHTPFYRDRVPRFAKQLFTFTFVSFAWIFFKASSFSDAWLVVTRIFRCGLADPKFPLLALILIFSVWIYQFAYESRFRRALGVAPVRVGLVVLMVVYLALAGSSGAKEFIYLQF